MNTVTKWIIACLLVMALHSLAVAQLTITDADVSTAITNSRATTYSVTFDVPISFDLGLAASGQSWNFLSALAGADTARDTTIEDYIMPTGLPGAAQFPTATGAVRTDIVPFPGAQFTIVNYFHLETSGLYGLGSANKQFFPPFIDTLIITKSMPMALYLPLPLTVGTNRTSTDTIYGGSATSIVTKRTYNADGHGTLTYPDGASRKVLRTVIDHVIDDFSGGFPVGHDHFRSVSFIAKDGSIMTFDVVDTAYTTGTTLVSSVSFEKKAGAVGVQSISPRVPEGFSLSQNYPNPFNPSTSVSFSIPNKEQVSLKVYNLLGSEVATLLNQELAPGDYTTDFNAANLPSGMYYYRMTAGNVVQVKKMSLVK